MKYNPVRICSCLQCRHSQDKRFYFHAANKKVKHQYKRKLRNFNLSDSLDKILIDGGYVT